MKKPVQIFVIIAAFAVIFSVWRCSKADNFDYEGDCHNFRPTYDEYEIKAKMEFRKISRKQYERIVALCDAYRKEHPIAGEF